MVLKLPKASVRSFSRLWLPAQFLVNENAGFGRWVEIPGSGGCGTRGAAGAVGGWQPSVPTGTAHAAAGAAWPRPNRPAGPLSGAGRFHFRREDPGHRRDRERGAPRAIVDQHVRRDPRLGRRLDSRTRSARSSGSVLDPVVRRERPPRRVVPARPEQRPRDDERRGDGSGQVELVPDGRRGSTSSSRPRRVREGPEVGGVRYSSFLTSTACSAVRGRAEKNRSSWSAKACGGTFDFRVICWNSNTNRPRCSRKCLRQDRGRPRRTARG